MEKIYEAILTAIIAPILYFVYGIAVILLTFVLGLPIAIGIYVIDIAMKLIFNGG